MRARQTRTAEGGNGMKRLLILGVAASVALAIAGCAPSARDETPGPETGTSGTPSEAVREPQSADAFEPMPVEGVGEAAAMASLPQSLAEAQAMREAAGLPWPDLSGVEPFLNAYIISADMAGQTALSEVRADGRAHSIYAYQRAFDAATLIWSPAESVSSPRAEPQSPRETAAVEVVRAELRDAFPEGAPSVAVYGYRFIYAKDGLVLLILEVATDGSVISAGS